MGEFLWTAAYGLIVALAIYAALSMEYYARKVKVTASPSLPWMRKTVIARLISEIENGKMSGPVVLELGSGFGTLAISAARACPDATIIGYEISPVPFYVSKLRAFLGGHKNLSFVAKDFMKHDLSQADIVLAYLNMPLMEKLGEKLSVTLKPGNVIISNTFPIAGWMASHEETVQNFVYTLKVFTYRMDGSRIGAESG